MHMDFETLLHEAGLTLAIGPLREMFSYEGISDPLVQSAMTLEVIERTVSALEIFTRPKPRTLH